MLLSLKMVMTHHNLLCQEEMAEGSETVQQEVSE